MRKTQSKDPTVAILTSPFGSNNEIKRENEFSPELISYAAEISRNRGKKILRVIGKRE